MEKKRKNLEEVVTFKQGDNVFYCRPDLNDYTASKGVVDRIEGENAFIVGVDVAIPIDCLQLNVPEPLPDIKPLSKPWPLADIMNIEFLDSIGFKVTKFDGQYGVAKSKKFGGRTIIKYNLEGYSCGYGGDKLPENIVVGITTDWDTRTVFNGYIENREQLELISKLTR